MEKINKITSSLVVAMLLASCAEKELPDSTNIPAGQSDVVVPTEIVATFEETKVSYSEIDAGSVYNLRPTWEVGDEIIALDDDDSTKSYKFTVKTVNTDRSAVLSGEVPKNCSLHLIYCPGVSASNLTVDYTAQTGAQKTMPAVLFSDGEVVEGAGSFTFRNAGAIIGIFAMKGVPQNSKVTKITVSGENLSAATIALSGSALALTATEKANDAITVGGLDLTVTDENGTLSAPVFLAVPAGAKIAKVSASVPKEPETMTIPSTSADKKDIDYVEIEAKYDGTNLSTKKWAKWNVGANSETDYGWYFAWGDTNGYVWKNSQWVSASGFETYSYFPSSAYTVIACDYVYVKTQTFTGHSFDWVNTPYHTGSSSSTGWTKYIPSNRLSYWSGTGSPDNKLVLDPEDDAARVNWGGSWRMPTMEEFKALYNATTWTWNSTDKGYYVTKKGEALSADKSNALLFFPATGYGDNASLSNAGSDGNYWFGALYSYLPYDAYNLAFSSTQVRIQSSIFSRCNGQSVRPLSD